MKTLVIDTFDDMHYLEHSPFSCQTLEVSLCAHTSIIDLGNMPAKPLND